MLEDKKTDLDAVVDYMWDTGVSIRKDGIEVAPIAFAFAGGDIAVMPLCEVPYDHWRDALCSLAMTGADLVGVLSEAWVVRVEGPKEVAAHQAASALGVRNSERDDRIEMLHLTAETPDGATFHFMAEIKDGVVGDKERTYEGVSGRLTGIFPPMETSGA